MSKKYSDEFKLSVVQDYYNSALGVRLIALKYNLPSKNYIERWEKYLKKKGLLPPNATKQIKAAGRPKEPIAREDTRTPREKQYEAEIQALKARIEYLESLESLQPFFKKKEKVREIKYRVIMELEFKYPVKLLCEIAGISTTAYYRYKNKPANKDDGIENLIVEIYNKTNKRAGYRMITQILRSRYKLVVNHKKVQRIMRKHDIYSIVRKKHKKQKEEAIIKENILDRDFKSEKPGEKFVTDITYIPTPRQMAYLCTVIDLFNNEPVARKISDKQDKSLSIDTIKILASKYDLRGSIIHSDQGIHYTNKDYVELLRALGAKQSMSRRGNCWDNAVAESFFSHLKCESIYLMKNKIKDINDVKEVIEEYIDYYINVRPQEKLGGMPPSLYREAYINR